MRLWRYTFRELWRRPGRTLVTLLGIVIGVMAVVSVSVSSSSARGAYERMFAAVGGKAALEVVAPGQGGFDPAIATTIEGVAGVAAAVPAIQTQAALVTDTGRTDVLILGVDPTKDDAVHDYTLAEGGLLAPTSGSGATGGSTAGGGAVATDGGLLLGKEFAVSQGLTVGSMARLLTPTGPTEVTVRGLLASGGVAIFNGGAVGVMQLADAQRLFGFGDAVNTVQVVLQDGADEAAAREAIAALLPTGLAVQTPASRGNLARASFASTDSGLSSLSALALVAGAFIILNTFLMSMGERRRELALLRALGTTRGQLSRLVVREALVLAGVGTAIGLAMGVLASAALSKALGGLLGVELPALELTPAPFVAGAVLGPALALVATYMPARRIGRSAPLEGLARDGERAGSRGVAPYVGLALAAAMLVLAGLFIAGRLPSSVVSPAFAAMLVGLVMALPLVVGGLSRFAGWMLRPLLGAEGGLALRHMARHSSRTYLTVGVLFVAVVVAVSLGGNMVNNINDTGDWYRRTVVGDYFVRGAMPDIGTIRAAALPEGMGTQIAALPGADRVDTMRFLQGEADGRQATIITRSFAPDRALPLDLQTGDPATVLRGLLAGDVVLGTGLARAAGVGVGDKVTLATRQGPQKLRVAGTVTEYSTGGMALYVDWATAKRLLDIQGVDLFLVAARPGQTEALGAALRQYTTQNGLLLQSLADFRVFIQKQIDGVVGALWLLVALIFVVAALGIANTLGMNVLEQTREIGLLRAVAMTRRQVRRMIVAQALAVAAIALPPGLAVGMAMGWLLQRGSNVVSGQPVVYQIQPAVIIGSVVVAVVFSVLAAYLPARRAANLGVIEALQYE